MGGTATMSAGSARSPADRSSREASQPAAAASTAMPSVSHGCPARNTTTTTGTSTAALMSRCCTASAYRPKRRERRAYSSSARSSSAGPKSGQ